MLKMPDNPSSIHHFRTNQYRVFLGEPYFKLDLEEEIRWHELHLKKLQHLADNPHVFHQERTSHIIDAQRERHFKEQVLDSIPFHEQILNDHKLRLATILELVPKKQYRKLHDLSVKYGAVADYFVFDRIEKNFFFAIEKPSPEKEKWARVVERKGLCKVVFLE